MVFQFYNWYRGNPQITWIYVYKSPDIIKIYVNIYVYKENMSFICRFVESLFISYRLSYVQY